MTIITIILVVFILYLIYKLEDVNSWIKYLHQEDEDCLEKRTFYGTKEELTEMFYEMKLPNGGTKELYLKDNTCRLVVKYK
jgi:hypothetical protein